MKKPELLAPVGNMEKLKAAVAFGADAVYCAGKRFGLRARADNFDSDALKEAVAYCHAHGVRLYVTLNMIPHDKDFEGLAAYVRFLKEIETDAVLVADPGVFALVRRTEPTLAVSISTQANNTNSETVAFWHGLGASRIVLARELSGREIAAICQSAPEGMGIETFVHGAMCIGYSGRCLLSHYLTGRNANQGDCAQPCRWQYVVTEATRPEAHFPLEDREEGSGSFIFNSKDLCLAREIPELMAMGVDSFKIEGRMKSAYYVALVVSVYRRIIDAVMMASDFTVPDAWVRELTKVSHRNYTTAFYYGKTTDGDQNYGTGSYTRNYDYVGRVLDVDRETGMVLVEQRTKIVIGDTLEILSPHSEALFVTQEVTALYDEDRNPIPSTPHPKMKFYFKTDVPVFPGDMIRRCLNPAGK